MGYIRLSYVEYRFKTQHHNYIQINVCKMVRGKYRHYRAIHFSQRFNMNIYDRDYFINKINELKKYYDVHSVVLSTTKKHPTRVNEYFEGITF